jgi:hypothetical protein
LAKWPDGLEPMTAYRIACDDKGAQGGAWLEVIIGQDGDVHVQMQEWEFIPEGSPHPLPGIRIRTLHGGGRNRRTRQALLWLADAIRRDNIDNSIDLAK